MVGLIVSLSPVLVPLAETLNVEISIPFVLIRALFMVLIAVTIKSALRFIR